LYCRAEGDAMSSESHNISLFSYVWYYNIVLSCVYVWQEFVSHSYECCSDKRNFPSFLMGCRCFHVDMRVGGRNAPSNNISSAHTQRERERNQKRIMSPEAKKENFLFLSPLKSNV
jgi:hypothetical protein